MCTGIEDQIPGECVVSEHLRIHCASKRSSTAPAQVLLAGLAKLPLGARRALPESLLAQLQGRERQDIDMVAPLSEGAALPGEQAGWKDSETHVLLVVREAASGSSTTRQLRRLADCKQHVPSCVHPLTL